MTGKVMLEGKLADNSKVVPPPQLKKKQKSKRDHAEIIYGTLLFIQSSGEVVKTNVMNALIFSFRQCEEILNQLIRLELVRLRKEGRKSYLSLTGKGKQAIKLGKEFLTLIGEL